MYFWISEWQLQGHRWRHQVGDVLDPGALIRVLEMYTRTMIFLLRQTVLTV